MPRLIVPIIWQILAPHRGTKRWPDARARADGGRRKRTPNAACLAKVAAEEQGEERAAGERGEDNSEDGDDGEGRADGDVEDVRCPSTHAHTPIAIALEPPLTGRERRAPRGQPVSCDKARLATGSMAVPPLTTPLPRQHASPTTASNSTMTRDAMTACGATNGNVRRAATTTVDGNSRVAAAAANGLAAMTDAPAAGDGDSTALARALAAVTSGARDEHAPPAANTDDSNATVPLLEPATDAGHSTAVVGSRAVTTATGTTDETTRPTTAQATGSAAMRPATTSASVSAAASGSDDATATALNGDARDTMPVNATTAAPSMSPLSMALTADTASVRQSSASNSTTTLVGDGSTGNVGGDMTLAAGDHGDADDIAQEVSDSADAHPDDSTDSYEEARQMAALMDATMLAGQKTQVLCIAFGESLSLSLSLSQCMLI